MAPKKFTYTPGTGGGKRTAELSAAAKRRKAAFSRVGGRSGEDKFGNFARDVKDVLSYKGTIDPAKRNKTTSMEDRRKAMAMGQAAVAKNAGRSTIGKDDVVVSAGPLKINLGKNPSARGKKAFKELVGVDLDNPTAGSIGMAAASALPTGRVARLAKGVAEAAKAGKAAQAAGKAAKTTGKAAKAKGAEPEVSKIDFPASTKLTPAATDASKVTTKPRPAPQNRPQMSKDALTRQRIASLEKLLKNGPAEQRATVQGLIDALKGPSAATKTIPPARFPKGKKYKTEAPGDRTPLTDKQANEIKDLMTPDVGRPASNVKVYRGNNKTTYREDQILIKQREAQEALAAEKKAAKEAEKAALIARGDKPLDSRGNLVEPQRSEDALSKFPEPPPAKPRPPRKPSEESLDKLTPEEAAAKLAKYEKNVSLAPRRNKAHQKKYDAWVERRDAWRKENPIPARFSKKPQPESPLANVTGKKPAAAADEIPKRPADSKFKSSKKKGDPRLSSEDYELRVFTKDGKRMAADVPAQNALDKLTGKTPLDYGKKPSGKGKAAKAEKPVEETPAAETPKPAKPAKPAAPAAEKPAPAAPKKPSAKKPKPSEAPKVETPEAPAPKPSRAKKPKPAEETKPAEAPKVSTPKKPKVKKEEAEEVVTYGTRKSDQFGPTSITPKRLEAAKAARAEYDAALKSGNPGRIRAARAKWNAFKKTKAFKVTAGSVVGASGALGVGGAIVGRPPGAKSDKATGAKGTYQAGTGMGMFSIALRNKARADKAAAAEAKNPKKFGAAGESKFLKGRSAVRQSVIDQINKQGMTKSLAAVKTRKNDPEYLEAIRRYYGAKRLKQALEG